MKKLTLFMIAINLSLQLAAQEKCTFFINDGKKAVDRVKYSEIDNLKFEVSYPKKCLNYDQISLDLNASWTTTKPYYNLTSFVKNQIADIAGKKIMYWMFNPANKDGVGDFRYLSQKVYLDKVNSVRLKEVEFELIVKGCMEIGTEQWYDDNTGTWQTRKKYGNCETLAKGKVVIESVFETSYTDPEGVVKINYIDPNITFPSYDESKWYKVPFNHVSIRMTENAEYDGRTVGASTVLNLYIVNIKSIEKLERYITAKATMPDYKPYQFVKDEIENYFKLNTFGCNPIAEEKRNKWLPAFDWVGVFTPCNGNYIPELNKFEIANPIVGAKKGISTLIWQKKTIGKYEYDCVQYDVAHYSRCMAGQMELDKKIIKPIKFIMIFRDPYIVVLADDYWVHNPNEKDFYNLKDVVKCKIVDEQKQKGYIQTLIEKLEFLK